MLSYPPRCGRGQVTSSLWAIVPLVAILVTPHTAMAHKVNVHDPVTAQSIKDDGGTLLADYGSFQVYEIDRLRPGLSQVDAVEIRDDWNRICLNATNIDTSTVVTRE